MHWLGISDQGRANWFLIGGGGVVQNLGPLPFQGPLKGGGKVGDMFSEKKILKIFRKTTLFQIIPLFQNFQPTNPSFF